MTDKLLTGLLNFKNNEPVHDKTNSETCATSEDAQSDQSLR